MKTRTLMPIALVAAIAVPATAMSASTKSVTMKNISLSPAKVTIKKGDTVKWLWRDGSIRHDVSWSTGGFEDSPLTSRSSTRYSVRFKKKGTFRYICSVHPGDMKGRVVVK